MPRFFRRNPRASNVTLEGLRDSLGPSVKAVSWLPEGYYTVDGGVKLASTTPFQAGHIYGIDGSSVAAVLAMDIRPGQHVLDIACAPGTKICLIADLLLQGHMPTKGLAVGVDGRLQRLFISRSQVTKYGLPNVRLIWADGTRFDPASDTKVERAASPFWDSEGRHPLQSRDMRKFKRELVKAQQRMATECSGGAVPASVMSILNGPPPVLQEVPAVGVVIAEPTVVHDPSVAATHPGPSEPQISPSTTCSPNPADTLSPTSTCARSPSVPVSCLGEVPNGQFDAVLVDPESSHDQDVRRMDKLLQGGLYWNEAPTAEVEKLYAYQYALLQQGWHLLRPHGTLVYTTCSLRREQNEDILLRLIAQHGPEQVKVVQAFTPESGVPFKVGEVAGTAYFTPEVSGTGGCFVAKLVKIPLH